jgi:ParB family chromosome partitioning protein
MKLAMEEKKNKKSVLGRGLGALIESNISSDPEIEQKVVQMVNMTEISIDSIEPNPFQPRTHFDEAALAELSASIKLHGVIQPITVRRLSENQYQIISGERRWQASKLAGLDTIPAYIRLANDEQMIEMALIENIQREDLNPIEVALGYKRLMDECNLVIEEVGDKVGKNRSTVNNYLRLLKLPIEIQSALKEKKISMGHARTLITVDSPLLQLSILQEILEKDLSVRAVEEMVRDLAQSKTVKKSQETKKKEVSAYEIHIREVQAQLAEKFNTKVQIFAKEENGKGKIEINFYNTEDLNRLLELLK